MQKRDKTCAWCLLIGMCKNFQTFECPNKWASKQTKVRSFKHSNQIKFKYINMLIKHFLNKPTFKLIKFFIKFDKFQLSTKEFESTYPYIFVDDIL